MSDLHVELTCGWDLPSGDAHPQFDVLVVAGDLTPRMELGVKWLLGRVPATWWRRSRFRAELRADLRDKPELLRETGIGVYEAQAEVSRYFWEALILERR